MVIIRQLQRAIFFRVRTNNPFPLMCQTWSHLYHPISSSISWHSSPIQPIHLYARMLPELLSSCSNSRRYICTNGTTLVIPGAMFHRKGRVCTLNCRECLKGCGMGPWLVLVSPCFRENVVATCKIGSFLCSLDNLLQKYVVVFFFGNQISKWRLFEKKGYFWPTFHIF